MAINFYVSAAFGATNANAIFTAIQQALSGPSSSNFFSNLPDGNYYIGQVNFDQNRSTPYNAGVLAPTGSYYSFVNGTVSSNPAPVGQTPGVTIQFDSVSLATFIAQSSEVNGVDGHPIKQSLARAIFHELAHSLEENKLTALLGEGTDGGYTNINNIFGYDGNDNQYAGAEAIAVAAENYIFAKDHSAISRVGHVTTEQYSKLSSYDPAKPFLHIPQVSLDMKRVKASGNGSTNGAIVAEFHGTNSSGVEVKKDYYQQSVKFTLTGISGSASIHKENNYITVTTKNNNMVDQSGNIGVGFQDEMTGVAAKSSKIVEKDVKSAANAIYSLNGIITPLNKSGITSLNYAFYQFDLSYISGIVGISNERFTSEFDDYVGPQDAGLAYSPASSLFVFSDYSAILLGASGYQGNLGKIKEVSYKNVPLSPNPFSNSSDVIEGGSQGHNIIIAGDAAEGKTNILIGGGDGDIIFGGSGNDQIWANRGPEIVFASAGQDAVQGDGQTIFAAADILGKLEFDVQSAPSSAMQSVEVFSNGRSIGTTNLSNTHILLGGGNSNNLQG